ncbi:MAG: DNA-3-methyladenine glycosylase 2 family protein [Trueperaceae bacterium]|nr:DNA-3-methyladenine glycosylase 2 family protein [Trueperaceae bacterium]
MPASDPPDAPHDPDAHAPTPPRGPAGEAVLGDEAALAAGVGALGAREPRFAAAVEAAGPPPLRARPDGFQALLRSVVSQQLSVAAAATIQGRLDAAGLTTPNAIRAADDDALRAAGVSRPKIRYLRGIADADLDYAALRTAPTEDVVAALVALPGIGRWTAEIYATFALLRADVFAAGDLALREGARDLFALPARPSEGDLRTLAQAWAPWRAVAARVLWQHYGAMRGRAGAP